MPTVETTLAMANIIMHSRSMTMAANFHVKAFCSSSSSSLIFCVITRISLSMRWRLRFTMLISFLLLPQELHTLSAWPSLAGETGFWHDGNRSPCLVAIKWCDEWWCCCTWLYGGDRALVAPDRFVIVVAGALNFPFGCMLKLTCLIGMTPKSSLMSRTLARRLFELNSFKSLSELVWLSTWEDAVFFCPETELLFSLFFIRSCLASDSIWSILAKYLHISISAFFGIRRKIHIRNWSK